MTVQTEPIGRSSATVTDSPASSAQSPEPTVLPSSGSVHSQVPVNFVPAGTRPSPSVRSLVISNPVASASSVFVT